MENINLIRRSVNPLSKRLERFGFFPSISYMMDEMMSDFNKNYDNFSVPSVNVKETDTQHQIQVSAPGYKKENFKIDIQENVLTISNENKEEVKDEKENYLRREFKSYSFKRRFYLPDNLKTDNVTAKYEDGVLYIDIPKEKISPMIRTIEIK